MEDGASSGTSRKNPTPRLLSHQFLSNGSLLALFLLLLFSETTSCLLKLILDLSILLENEWAYKLLAGDKGQTTLVFQS